MHILKANKPKCKGAISCKLSSTQTTMDRSKTWQNRHITFTNTSLKHAPTKANNLEHVKAQIRHYMATMLSMHGVPKPTQNHVISWIYKHEKQTKQAQHTLKHRLL